MVFGILTFFDWESLVFRYQFYVTCPFARLLHYKSI